MGDGFQFFDILILGAIAVFLVFRLRNTLGKRTGHQGPPAEQQWDNGNGDDNVVDLPRRQTPPPVEDDLPAGPLGAGVTQIRLADPSFELNGFLMGARSAFEMILEAFAKGDLGSLQPLLASDVYANFKAAVEARAAASEQVEAKMMGFKRVDAEAAGMTGATASVTVRFVSEQINVTYDADGKVVDGDPEKITQVIDVWTFERDTTSRDPNWQLVATATEG